MKTLQDFANTLTQAQKERELTAKELAEEVGLSDLSVRKILSGQSAPRLTNAMALASVLGYELVLVPKEVAQSFLGAKKPHTVLSNVERRLSMASKLAQDSKADKADE